MTTYGSIRQGELELPVFFGEWAQIRLPLVDGTTPTWRDLYNELAAGKEPPVPAAARGTEEHGVVLVTLRRDSSGETVKSELERAFALVRETNEQLQRREDAERDVHTAAYQWWQARRSQF